MAKIYKRMCFICENKQYHSDVAFHRFPKNIAIRDKWVLWCNANKRLIQKEDNLQNVFICSYHFNETDFIHFAGHKRRNRLKLNSVPSIKKVQKCKREFVDVTSSCESSTSNACYMEYPEGILEVEIGVTENTIKGEDIFIDFQQDYEEKQAAGDESEVIEVIDGPIGDEFFRVCRTCLKIIKIEDAVSLDPVENSESIELQEKIKSILQMDLLPVEKPNICKTCIDLINATCNFKETCKKNETQLEQFDWNNKNKNLLYYVDQDDLKYKYNETRMSQMNEDRPYLYINDQIEIDWDKFWDKLDKEGNGLSDMEDHWYDKPQPQPVKVFTDHNYYSVKFSMPVGSKLPVVDDLFSPEFDKYFEFHQFRPVQQQFKKKCRRYHSKDFGPGPYLCEYCGKLKGQKFKSHLKEHGSFKPIECKDCDDQFFGYASYKAHCQIKHGGFPKLLKCHLCSKTYTTRYRMQRHLRTHGVTKAKPISAKTKLKNIFVCNVCNRKYLHNFSLKRHKEMAHGYPVKRMRDITENNDSSEECVLNSENENPIEFLEI